MPLPLSRAAGSATGSRGKLSERSEFLAPPVVEFVARGFLNGTDALFLLLFLGKQKKEGLSRREAVSDCSGNRAEDFGDFQSGVLGQADLLLIGQVNPPWGCENSAGYKGTQVHPGRKNLSLRGTDICRFGEHVDEKCRDFSRSYDIFPLRSK
jgi:hypothetical protein